MIEAPFTKNTRRTPNIDVLVLFLPSTSHTPSGGENSVSDSFVVGNTTSHIAACETHARSQLKNIRSAKPLAKDGYGAVRGLNERGQHSQKGSFSGAVGADDDPSLRLVHRPRDVTKDGAAVSNEADVVERSHCCHCWTSLLHPGKRYEVGRWRWLTLER